MRLTGPCAVLAVLLAGGAARAGPPYLSDDPEPTDYRHFEIYAFNQGASGAAGTAGATGIDFNYGGAPDLQLTAVLPLEFDTAGGTGIGNVELAAKYRFVHQDDIGWDIAVFPRVFLPSPSRLGDGHASFMLPFWAEKDIGKWSTFGGGGCVLNRGGDSRDFCFAGWALTREVADSLRLGAEFFYQGHDAADAKAEAMIGFGATFDLDDNHHLMAWYGPGLENAATVGQHNWYAAMLFTF